jgi:hypothetical protein
MILDPMSLIVEPVFDDSFEQRVRASHGQGAFPRGVKITHQPSGITVTRWKDDGPFNQNYRRCIVALTKLVEARQAAAQDGVHISG